MTKTKEGSNMKKVRLLADIQTSFGTLTEGTVVSVAGISLRTNIGFEGFGFDEPIIQNGKCIVVSLNINYDAGHRPHCHDICDVIGMVDADYYKLLHSSNELDVKYLDKLLENFTVELLDRPIKLFKVIKEHSIDEAKLISDIAKVLNITDLTFFNAQERPLLRCETNVSDNDEVSIWIGDYSIHPDGQMLIDFLRKLYLNPDFARVVLKDR